LTSDDLNMNIYCFLFVHDIHVALIATASPVTIVKLALYSGIAAIFKLPFAHMDMEYCFVSHSMALGEMPLIMPHAQTHQWNLLSPTNSYKVLVNQSSPIFLTSFADGEPPQWAKFEFRETNNDGVSIYVSPRGYGAVLRRIPYRNCKLKVEVRRKAPPRNWIEVSCQTETGESLFHQIFKTQEHVTASQLNRKVKSRLVSEDRATDNSIFSLHWNFDSPCLKPGSLIWRPPRRVALRRPAAAGHD
jgi:hypothetical protein